MGLPPTDSEQWPGFEVAIEGEGLSPSDIPARQLAELLHAAAATVDAIAKARGVTLPPPRLVAVRRGSAAYDLRIPDESAASVVEEIEGQIRQRGRDAPPAVRDALGRLHDCGRGIGGVRFTAFAHGGRRHQKPLRLAPLLEAATTPTEFETEVYGRLVGLAEGRGERVSSRLRLDDGGTAEFDVDADLAAQAARLFLRKVRVRCSYRTDADGDTPLALLAIEPWDPIAGEDIVAGFAAARESLIERGLNLRASDWLRELAEDDA